MGDLAQARQPVQPSSAATQAAYARRLQIGSPGPRMSVRCSSVRASTGSASFGSALYWAGDMLCLWAALQLVGGNRVTIAALVLAYSGGYVLTRRALPAGGAGVVEVALTFALVGMGVRFVPALIGVLVYRLFNFWLPIVPSLLLLPTIRELRARFQRAERTTYYRHARQRPVISTR